MAHPRDDAITNDAPAAQRLKLTHDHAPVGISQLPSSLVSGRIFDFLADVQSPQFLRDGLDLTKYKTSLSPLAGVCREWRDHAKARVVHAKSVSCTLDMRKGTAKSILKRATKEGASVLELKLVMGDIREAGLLREKHTVKAKYAGRQWWESFFQCFPNVVRLDLSRVSLELVPVALETASSLCPTVKSLGLLCGPMNHEDENWESFPKMATALLDALGRWHAANGGLRALMMPAFVSHEESVYERFIRAVASYCPQIEYLVSSTTTQGDTEMQEDWPTLSVDAWAEFCRQCPLLREFSWNIAPITSEHVEAFAATPKLQLQELKLFSNTNDPWPVDHIVLGRVFDAVPRLKSLYVEFDGEEEYESDEEDEDGTPKAKVTMPTKIANIVAAKCPKLEEISFDGTTDEWIHRMSGEAAEALVKLPSVSLLELPLISTMGNQTLVEVVQTTLSSTAYSSRTVAIGAADYIYPAIVELLRFMDQQPEASFQGKTLKLTVAAEVPTNENGVYIQPTPECLVQQQTLETLVETIKQKHSKMVAYVHVDILAKRMVDGPVQFVEEFSLLLNVDSEGVKAYKKERAEARGRKITEEQDGKDPRGGVTIREEKFKPFRFC